LSVAYISQGGHSYSPKTLVDCINKELMAKKKIGRESVGKVYAG